MKEPSNLLVGKAFISPRAIIRADLQIIRIGNFSIISDKAILSPGAKSDFKFANLTIENYVIIGNESVIKGSIIRSGARVGKRCVVREGCIINKNAVLLDNSVLPRNTVIPQFCVFGGKPAKFIKRLPWTIQTEHIIEAIRLYESIVVK